VKSVSSYAHHIVDFDDLLGPDLNGAAILRLQTS
jgi:hypothetical protein